MNITKHFLPNLIGRDFVVGDLHGMYDLFVQKLKEIEFDESKDRMFCVGDLIDRGPDSLKCLELLLNPWFFSNRGNHEDQMLDRTIGSSLDFYHPTDWIKNGGKWYLDTTVSDKIMNKITEMPLISVVHKADGTRTNIVHAEFPAYTTDDKIDDEDFTRYQIIQLIWQRFRVNVFDNKPTKKQIKFYNKMDENLSPTYAGHTIFKNVKKLGKYTFIDTGAYLHNKLTIVQI
jgi:serine/threonine protein phosphatase 1